MTLLALLLTPSLFGGGGFEFVALDDVFGGRVVVVGMRDVMVVALGVKVIVFVGVGLTVGF